MTPREENAERQAAVLSRRADEARASADRVMAETSAYLGAAGERLVEHLKRVSR